MPTVKKKEESPLFWADKTAEDIHKRRSFHYTKDPVPEMEKFVVKTSASISGVLHIGRLSDTIRGESVVRALLDQGRKAEFIWVAEDMDPLRKIPKGVPAKFESYIGAPVTDIPDPFGCHKTYAEHHVAKYFEVLEDFVSVKMKKYSTREEYRKGSFRPYIKKVLENLEKVREIQNRYRSNPLPEGWSPWKPVCENCGKIITTNVSEFRDGKAIYKCSDYHFEKTKALGCGHEGDNDPLKGNGKLVWKSEWAAQWALWKVCSEGAGKEYQVPNSAWWVNGEIVERVLGFPMPVPIFYEHLMIDGEKMSASKGNVVYPADWLEVAPPELLRFFYNKKIMKTRSFSYEDLAKIYDDFDNHEAVFFGEQKTDNEKETGHMKRLYEISMKTVPVSRPFRIPFDFAVAIAQLAPEKELAEKGLEILKRTGHIKGKADADVKKDLKKRLLLAKKWAEKHAPERYRFRLQESPKAEISDDMRKILDKLVTRLRQKELDEESLKNLFFEISRGGGIKPRDFFKNMYRILIGKDYGPRLAPFVIGIGQKKVADILEKA